MPPTVAFEGDPAEAAVRRRTLRLALAMRGGVSLAVWIGGAVAEIDLFRRACAGEIHPEENKFRQGRAECYKQLLETTAFSRVEIDILAGASAGGLNAILYGLSQSCTTVMDEAVRETWIKDGGIWELLRDRTTLAVAPPTGKRNFWGRILDLFPDRRVPSILQGDQRLYPVARKALEKLAVHDMKVPPKRRPLEYTAQQGIERPTLTVELAATLLDDTLQPAAGNRAGFSFRNTEAALSSRFSTIPDRNQARTPEGQRALDRMALAARSTSSFPGAFEPASINSVSYLADPATNSPLAPAVCAADSRTGIDVNMARVFPHARVRTSLENAVRDPTSEPYGVVDGGIFDNIPIDRAIRAIQRAPTSQPSERRLVYVDPEPPSQPSAGATLPDLPTATSWIPVIRSSLAFKQRNEVAVDEVDMLRQHNDEVLQKRGRLEALAALLSRVPSPPPGPPAARDDTSTTLPPWIAVSESAYRQSRIAQDAARIATLLTDPRSELCQPPRPAVAFVPLKNTQALSIKNQVGAAYNDLPPDYVISDDVYALLDRVRVMLTWTHGLEGLTEALRKINSPIDTGPLSDQLSSVKGVLYCYVAVLVEAKHIAIDAILAEPLRTRDPASGDDDYPLGPLLDTSRDAQAALRLPEELAKLLAGEPSVSTFAAELSRWVSNPCQGRAFLDTIGQGLQTLREQLGEKSLDVVLRAGVQHPKDRETQPWRESLFEQFYRTDFRSVTLTELTKLFSVTGTPSASIIAFELINSAAQPQIPIPLLVRGARAQYLLSWVKTKPTAAQIARTVADERALDGPEAKLAGNVLSRFGGFFSARWRENDWQWGRLDAAAGIAKLLDALKTAPAGTEGTAQEEINGRIACLQTSILRESKFTTGTPEDQPALVQSVGAETFDAISPHYRFALASRAVPLVLRALIPPRESASLLTIARHIAIIAARPLLVPLTLRADLLRLVLAFVIVVTSAGLLGTSGLTLFWQRTFAVLLAGAGILIAVRAYRTHARWREVGTHLKVDDTATAGSEYTPWQEMFRAAHPKTWIRLSTALAVVVILFGALRFLASYCEAVPQILPRSLPIEAVVLVFSVVVGLQHWFNARCYSINPERATGGKGRGPQYLSMLSKTTGRVFKLRSPEQSRVVRAVLSVVALALAVAGYVISTQDTAIATYLRETDDAGGALRAAGVATVTVTLLSAISLWGWAGDRWAVVLALGTGALAGATQFVLDWACPGADYRAVYDLLPAVVWMVTLGFAVQFVPHRTDNSSAFDAHTVFGEKNRPIVEHCYRDAPSAQTDAPHECEPALVASP